MASSYQDEIKEKIKGLTKEEAEAKLNNDLDDYIQNLAKQQKENKSAEEKKELTIDEKIEELYRHPAFMQEIDFSKPLSPDLEGLMRLKYEDEDPTAKAESYKDEGNYLFKKKQYKTAIENYTEGIKCKCPDRQLNAILYSNRAACHYHLGNYRSSLNDSIFSRKFKSTHMKSIVRGAMCCLQLKRYDDVKVWCDAGLFIDLTNKELLEIKLKADHLKKAQDRDRRKEEAKERKEQEAERKLLTAINQRGVELAGMKLSKNDKKLDPLLLTSLETHNPSGAKVHEDAEGHLVWPVLFMYPEHTQTDFIEGFNELHRFVDHIEHMFNPEMPPPPWDTDNKYKPNSLQVYFEDKEKEVLYKLDKEMTLLEALTHKRYTVHAGTPCFILTVDNSPFMTSFVKHYKDIVTVNVKR